MPQSVVLETVNDLIQHLRDPLIGLPVILGLALLILLSPLLTDPYGFNKYPGPLAAKVSRLWLARAAGKGDRYATVHKLHKKHGKFLRIAPDHISIADHRAIPIVYGHGTGFIKSDFYDAFVSIRRGLFNTRDRQEHTRKRKIVSHVFSQKNVLSFEQHIHTVIHELFGKWDQLCDQAIKHPEASSKFKGQATMDILNWTNFFAFDVIGSLAFGKPFGMVSSAKDIAPVQLENSTKTIYLPAIQILNTRGEFSATTGCIPPALRPYAKKLPWFKRGVQSVGQLAGIAIAAVKERLENPGVGAEREDLLSKLQAGKDENGNPMGREELTAEALTQLIAGSDTTSNSSCAIFYHLSNNPSVITTLRAELDSVAEEKGGPDSFLDFDYEDLKSLPYLQACIDEALRIHSTSAIGLPRIVPEGGAEVCGKWFPGGTTLSVPAYTVHRDPEVWGNDPDAYRPERWFEQNKEKMAASFIPFSFGPRSCVGRNLASMELLLIIASTVYRYDITPMYPGKPLNTIEGFLRKPTEFDVAMKRRVFS